MTGPRRTTPPLEHSKLALIDFTHRNDKKERTNLALLNIALLAIQLHQVPRNNHRPASKLEARHSPRDR